MSTKPLGRKNYGSIPHLPGSRMGPADKTCHEGQARIATAQARDRHDDVIIQEKLDGSNVGVARIGDTLHSITRAGWPAASSPFEQHRLFADWVYANYERFLAVLQDGERLVGEWMAQAHGTRYHLLHDPFVAFDLMVEDRRTPYDEFTARLRPGEFVTPVILHRGGPCSIDQALARLKTYGFHGALDTVEGAIWRVECNRLVDRRNGRRERVVDFLVKYVRPDKVDGCYLPEITGGSTIWNWRPA